MIVPYRYPLYTLNTQDLRVPQVNVVYWVRDSYEGNAESRIYILFEKFDAYLVRDTYREQNSQKIHPIHTL